MLEPPLPPMTIKVKGKSLIGDALRVDVNLSRQPELVDNPWSNTINILNNSDITNGTANVVSSGTRWSDHRAKRKEEKNKRIKMTIKQAKLIVVVLRNPSINLSSSSFPVYSSNQTAWTLYTSPLGRCPNWPFPFSGERNSSFWD